MVQHGDVCETACYVCGVPVDGVRFVQEFV